MAISASSWQCISEVGTSQPIDATSTTQKHPLRHVVTCRDTSVNDRGEAKFVYMGGLDTTAAGNLVFLDGDLTELTVANGVGPAAVAMSACPTNSFGWYQLTGQAIITSGTVSDNAQMYVTASAGSIDDAIVAGDEVIGCRSMGASDTGQTLCVILYPKCINNL